jgi:hypothetical protein
MSRKITRLNDNYIKTNDLPRLSNGNINWKKTSGSVLNFKYCGVYGTIKILSVTRENNKTTLHINYNNILFDVSPNVIRECKLGNIISHSYNDILIKWSFDIGYNIFNEVFIIDRKIENGHQYYKIFCKKCGFRSQEYFVNRNKNNIHYDEYWIESSVLKEMKGCPCCSKKSSIVVKGINDIATTDPWMIQYFVDKENAYKYSSASSVFIMMRCNDCGNERKYKISALKMYGHLPCACNDNYSIPNKFSYFLFQSINNIENYEREYHPDWLKPYYYDNYFEYKGNKYIVEMDGGLGHGKKSFGSNVTDTVGLAKDQYKDKLSKEHGITVIRINADKSDLDFLKNNTINALSKIIDLSQVDWETIYKKAISNIVKKVCEYANDNYKFVGDKYKESKYIDDISNNFNLAHATVIRFLKIGRNFGWCEYISCHEKSKIIEEKVYNLYKRKRNQSYKEIAQKLDIEIYDVASATKKLIKNNKIKKIKCKKEK